MSAQSLRITSVNMGCRNEVFHVLLQSSNSNILLIQEPWYGWVNTLRSDADPEGVPVLDTVFNNHWFCFLPLHALTEHCKVAIFVWSHLTSSLRCLNMVDHPCASPSSMVLRITLDSNDIFLLNFYHDVPKHGHGLHSLFSFSPPSPVSPFFIMGDFNTHSPLWSLPGATLSSWHRDFAHWLDAKGWLLINPPLV